MATAYENYLFSKTPLSKRKLNHASARLSRADVYVGCIYDNAKEVKENEIKVGDYYAYKIRSKRIRFTSIAKSYKFNNVIVLCVPDTSDYISADESTKNHGWNTIGGFADSLYLFEMGDGTLYKGDRHCEEMMELLRLNDSDVPDLVKLIMM